MEVTWPDKTESERVDLFGAVPYFAAVCVISYVFSSHLGIYGTPRVGTPKLSRWLHHDRTVGGVAADRRRWLPERRPPAAATPDLSDT